jgi:hypothetical protein
MPKNLNNEQINVGDIVFEWSLKEYEKHDRNRRWYIVMGILFASLLLYAILSANNMFALIIILFVIILFLQNLKEAPQVAFFITETGVILGDKYYPFSELQDFWIIYEPPMVKNLYFSTGSLIKHRISVPLLDNDPRPIRVFLSSCLEENLDEEEEPLTEKFARMFKL